MSVDSLWKASNSFMRMNQHLKHLYHQRPWRTQDGRGARRGGSLEPQKGSQGHGQLGQKGKRETKENDSIKIMGEKEEEML